MRNFLSSISDKRFLLRVISCYIFATFVLLIVYPFYNSGKTEQLFVLDASEERRIFEHRDIVSRYYEARKHWNTSNLGSILFKNEPCEISEKENKTFIVLIWRYWDWLKKRHVKSFSVNRNSLPKEQSELRVNEFDIGFKDGEEPLELQNYRDDPLEDCSVKNCKFIGNDDELDTADAVVIHIQHGLIPTVKKRNRKQRWVFLNDESPRHSFSMAKLKPNLADWSNVFNWSMMYRSDADIPVPYGRTISLTESYNNVKSVADYVPNWNKKRRDVLVTVLMSNCNVRFRMEFLKELQKHLNVDVYGKCSQDKKERCPGHFKSDCDDISEYLFYLVLENSQCHQYLTEKGFSNAYSKGAIPIILGPSEEDCKSLLPPNSYLHAENYETIKELAEKIMSISQNNETLLSYHKWRNNFQVVNEHGYLNTKSYHLCRLCEGLNYNDESEKIYDENSLRLFLDPNISCR